MLTNFLPATILKDLPKKYEVKVFFVTVSLYVITLFMNDAFRKQLIHLDSHFTASVEIGIQIHHQKRQNHDEKRQKVITKSNESFPYLPRLTVVRSGLETSYLFFRLFIKATSVYVNITSCNRTSRFVSHNDLF